jgi:hypothetical protein
MDGSVAVLPSSLDEHPPQVKLHSSVEEARACMLSLGRPSVKLEVSVVALEIAAVPSALKDLQAGRMLPHSGSRWASNAARRGTLGLLHGLASTLDGRVVRVASAMVFSRSWGLARASVR